MDEAAAGIRRAPEREPARDDPFDGYGPVVDDLDLASLREAARRPMTPIEEGSRRRTRAGSDTTPKTGATALDAAPRVDVER